jgi:uncharacterized damage-inducible protein DinB
MHPTDGLELAQKPLHVGQFKSRRQSVRTFSGLVDSGFVFRQNNMIIISMARPGEFRMQDDVVALFAYDRWANTKVLDACRKLTAEQYVAQPVPGWSSVRSTIYHIAFATERNLLTLAGDSDESIPTEADLATVDDVARLLEHAYRRFEELRPTLTRQRLNIVLTLRAVGRTFTLPRWAILRHIVNHSTYHRGQVASKLKQFGIEQPNTDFFWWMIEQVPQEP